MDKDSIKIIWTKIAGMARSDLYNYHICSNKCSCVENLEREIAIISAALGVEG